MSYLHKLLMLLTGNFGKKGSSYIPTMMAQSLGVADGKRARLITRRGSVEVLVEVSDRVQRGHLPCRTDSASTIPQQTSREISVGVGPNELTRIQDRDWVAGTPWHKSTPALVEAL
ncbi:MAG TPA: molybdopterin dinucleotide binding domain-containing protein [Candidatus Binataceae bacterium]|nr:molybdopterin dinucleotide binding domain-containing protein [Candidatus Binataceae bacterium]